MDGLFTFFELGSFHCAYRPARSYPCNDRSQLDDALLRIFSKRLDSAGIFCQGMSLVNAITRLLERDHSAQTPCFHFLKVIDYRVDQPVVKLTFFEQINLSEEKFLYFFQGLSLAGTAA